MRVGGWIMFVLGILLALAVPISWINGDGLPLRTLIYSIFLAVAGWRLKTFGTGLVSSRGESNPGSASEEVYTGWKESGQPKRPENATVEVPFTTGVAELIRDSARKTGRVMAIAVGLVTIMFLIIGAAKEALRFVWIMALGFAFLFGLLWFFVAALPAWRDLRAKTYLRSRGPIQLVSMGNGFMLRFADRAISLSKGPANMCLAQLNWAVVDYSRYTHVILGVWDSDGKNLFLADGYRPETLILVDVNA